MKIVTYNVNGIRSAIQKGFAQWAKATDADCLCMQEVKAGPDQVNTESFEEMGYQHFFWNPAEKKGYSGVAIFSKLQPVNVHYGVGNPVFDSEGRALRIDYENYSVLNVYMPSGSSGEIRQGFKYQWLEFFETYIKELNREIPRLIVCGDFNICHRPIDIHNPKSNANSSGFLPRERDWMEKYFNSGFTDSFRHFNQEPHNYTWWTYRAGARGRNLGWRIDYITSADILKPELKRCVILKDAQHSDHCPVLLEI